MLVLEQNSYLGGGASTYQINGVDFDIGTYFVGQESSKFYGRYNSLEGEAQSLATDILY